MIYLWIMIGNFGCKNTKKVWESKFTNKWSVDIQNRALRKLYMIHAAEQIEDLMVPPSNHLHKLRGNLGEFYAIRINLQWRIIFKWENSHAYDVQIVDYH